MKGLLSTIQRISLLYDEVTTRKEAVVESLCFGSDKEFQIRAESIYIIAFDAPVLIVHGSQQGAHKSETAIYGMPVIRDSPTEHAG